MTRIVRSGFDVLDIVPGLGLPEFLIDPEFRAGQHESILRDIAEREGSDVADTARRSTEAAMTARAAENEARWEEWIAAARPRIPGFRYTVDLTAAELPSLLHPSQWEEIAAAAGQQLDFPVAALRADLLAFRTQTTAAAARSIARQIRARDVAHDQLAPALPLFAGRLSVWLDGQRNLEDLPGLLTPEQWFAIARATEDGPLPSCCGNISDFRDELLGFLRTPWTHNVRDITRALLTGTAGCGDLQSPALDRFGRRLARWLDVNEPDWRTSHGPTGEELAAFDIRIRLDAARAPDGSNWEGRPRQAWDTLLALVIDRLFIDITPLPEDALTEWHENVKVALGKVLEAGAPVAVVRGLYDVMIGLLRDAYQAGEGRRG